MPPVQHQQPNSTNLLKPTDSGMRLQDSFNLITIESKDARSSGIYNKACQEGEHSQPYAKEMNSNDNIGKASERVQEERPPRDKWNIVQIILIIQGLATLMPWNMFINAKSYFENYKLSTNGTDQEINEYKTNFMSYITICSMVPSVIFSVLNTFITRNSGASPIRIVAAKIIMIILLAMTIVLACLDTSSWIKVFFILTLCTVIMINSATSIFQNNLFGISSVLPGKYINAVLIGANSCGILTSVSQIISIAISSDAKISAIVYFSSGILILIIALITNRIFQRLSSDMQATRSIQLLSSLNFHKPDLKGIEKEVMEHNWSASLSTEDIDIKLQHFMTIMHDICSKFAPERMPSQQKNIIPRDRRILMRQQAKISNCLNGPLKDNKRSYLKRTLLEIENELKRSHEKERAEKEARVVKNIKTNLKAFYRYAKEAAKPIELAN
ncbi:uncharacterized protein LOC106868784 [Octopus bimaculoides]|uniref:uncharacterized protein LOC106868784 n=1 Tax=Octopus bimaculoides TaxID=37653 RepID=UPI00071DBAC0|nr:uncharacterized protein LOC106868784 [Octopus bimaculoides]|eukprot:XP_014769691.1 PREDICTED: uncharacterized protein LOC106868784 [Octopus bimaculoides]